MMRRLAARTTVLSLSALSLSALAGLAACGGTTGTATAAGASAGPATAPPAAPAGPVSVRVVGDRIEMPDTVPGPNVDLDIVNASGHAVELALSRVAAETPAEDILGGAATKGDKPAWLLGDPGGVTLLGDGERLGYQRRLDPGRYLLFDPMPTPDSSTRQARGEIRLFTVTDAGTAPAAPADLTVSLGDDAITVPAISAGTHRVAVTNTGSRPHEVFVGGLPSDDDFAATEKLGSWLEGGQPGTRPLPAVQFPGGQQSIDPGVTVVLTMTFRGGYTYHLDDSTGEQPIEATVAVP